MPVWLPDKEPSILQQQLQEMEQEDESLRKGLDTLASKLLQLH